MKRSALCLTSLIVSQSALSAPMQPAASQSTTAIVSVPSPVASSSLSPASSSRTGTPQIVVNIPKQERPPWYEDVWKTLVGSFLGATLAFGSAFIHRRLQQRNTEIAAGNMALFHLRAIQRQTTEMRLGIRIDISRTFSKIAEAPEWSIIRPSLRKPDENIAIDFDSLSFLVSSARGQEALLSARHVQELYQSACNVFAQQQESAIAYQTKLENMPDANEFAVDGVFSWKRLEKHIGLVLVGNRETIFRAHLLNVEVNPSINRKAFGLLQDELVERFGRRVWSLGVDPHPTDNRAEANLPALPEYLQVYAEEHRALERKVRSQSAGNSS
jgi:hypothetical protein